MGLFNADELAGGQFLPHQLDGIRWLSEPVAAGQRSIKLLADEMGLGKTVQACGLIAHQFGDNPDHGPVLILVPAGIISQWLSELKRWLPSVPVTKYKPGAVLPTGDKIMVCSHSMLARHGKKLAKRSWRLIVVDELAAVGKAKVTNKPVRMGLSIPKQLNALAVVTAKAERVVGMTATPMENSAAELWANLHAIGVQELPPWDEYRTWLRWRTSDGNSCLWCQLPERLRFPPTPEGFNPVGACQMRRLLGAFMLRRVVADIPTLPMPVKVGDGLAWVRLWGEQAQAYGWAEQIGGLEGHQQCEMTARFHNDQSALVDEAVRRINLLPNQEKVILYAENLRVLDLLEVALNNAGITHARIDGFTEKAKARPAVIADHKHPSGARCLLGTKAIEIGHNLQHCRVLISVDPSWNPARENQRVGRICRIGSPHATYQHTVLIPYTHQHWHKFKVLERKQNDAALVGLAPWCGAVGDLLRRFAATKADLGTAD